MRKKKKKKNSLKIYSCPAAANQFIKKKNHQTNFTGYEKNETRGPSYRHRLNIDDRVASRLRGINQHVNNQA